MRLWGTSFTFWRLGFSPSWKTTILQNSPSKVEGKLFTTPVQTSILYFTIHGGHPPQHLSDQENIDSDALPGFR
jgi:hypothetical protein